MLLPPHRAAVRAVVVVSAEVGKRNPPTTGLDPAVASFVARGKLPTATDTTRWRAVLIGESGVQNRTCPHDCSGKL